MAKNLNLKHLSDFRVNKNLPSIDENLVKMVINQGNQLMQRAL